uniref:Uncharacterized protein n=1 Tax=Timema genevievae TaxID=629358 RepID=A0A7R9PQW7_TIMGE|nr:unnamed protein product [Timema genevievae]
MLDELRGIPVTLAHHSFSSPEMSPSLTSRMEQLHPHIVTHGEHCLQPPAVRCELTIQDFGDHSSSQSQLLSTSGIHNAGYFLLQVFTTLSTFYIRHSQSWLLSTSGIHNAVYFLLQSFTTLATFNSSSHSRLLSTTGVNTTHYLLLPKSSRDNGGAPQSSPSRMK